MAQNLKDAVALKNAKLDAITTYAGTSAKLRIYDGSQPANPDTAVSTQNMLVELICNATAFAGAASGGVLTANAISNGTGAAAAGTGTNGTWFRIWKSNGTTPVFDGTVGTSAADLILNNASIANGQTVSVTSLTRTAGN
jgi:two-component sensor histidine kinase